jgi:hypothetical protein
VVFWEIKRAICADFFGMVVDFYRLKEPCNIKVSCLDWNWKLEWRLPVTAKNSKSFQNGGAWYREKILSFQNRPLERCRQLEDSKGASKIDQ